MESRQDWRTVLPYIVGIASFALLAWFNHERGFDLWRNYALSGMVLGSIATWLLWHYDLRLPHYIQWIMVAGLWLHYGGGSIGSPDPYKMGLLGSHGINGAYHTFDWWDNLTHGVGIGASAMGFAYLLEVYQHRRGLGWGSRAVWMVSMLTALTAGVGVELYEYLGKTLFQTIDQGGYENTMTDLIFNLLGALAGATIAVTINRRFTHARIESKWGPPPTTPEGPRKGLSPNLLGLLWFVTIPACTALFLAARFLLQETPAQDLALYDQALRTLTRSAVLAIVGALAITMVAKELLKRQGATA